MEFKRKRSLWDDEQSWHMDNEAALVAKKQRGKPPVVDLSTGDVFPHSILATTKPVHAQKRVESTLRLNDLDDINKRLEHPYSRSKLDAIEVNGFDDHTSPYFPRKTDGKGSKSKFYAVAVGRTPGVYTDWSTAERQVKRFSGATYKSFRTVQEAEDYLNGHDRVQSSKRTNAFLQDYEHRQSMQSQDPHTSDVNVARDTSAGILEDWSSEDEERDQLLMEWTDAMKPYETVSAVPVLDSMHAIAVGGDARVEPELCQEQRDLVNLILSGRNVFYTGSAGCGKSTVLRAFVKALKELGRNVVIVAPTGKAALEINGSTYFTFAGWTPDHFRKPLKKLREGAHGRFVNMRMRSVNVLIIDEISMMENHAFERLNEVMKEARGSDAAFGGVQLIVTGDFCQLPPVKPFRHCMYCGQDTQERSGGSVFSCKKHGEFHETDKWAFKSRAWEECSFAHVNLTTIHRQKDRQFIDILERCRMGQQLSASDRDLLLDHPCEVDQAVRLFSTREEVRQLNYQEYSKLHTEPRKFQCYDDIQVQEAHPHLKFKAARLPDGSLAALREQKFETCVELREGMRVVLQVNLNIDAGLVNGSQGMITGWELYDEARLPKADKSRGSAPPINTIAGGEHAVYRETHVKAFIQAAQVKEWPVVRFENGVVRTIYAECVVSELGDSEPHTLMSRTQIPLLAGWAMTVHKSQGMTLSKVEVDLGRAFEEGQMYVALSRARSLAGLKVRSLGRWSGGGNDQVMQFLKDKFGIGA